MMMIKRDAPILVVDDNPDDRFIIEYVLRLSELDNVVLMFSSGEEVLAHLSQVGSGTQAFPALILLDVNLPGTTGFDVLEDLRDNSAFQRLPVIAMLTSSDATFDRDRATELGAHHFLAKQTGVDAFVSMFNLAFSNAA